MSVERWAGESIGVYLVLILREAFHKERILNPKHAHLVPASWTYALVHSQSIISESGMLLSIISESGMLLLLQAGRTIGTIGVELRRKATGQLVASGVHVKHLAADEPGLSVAAIPRSKL
jgi:hypothetical protein